MIAIDTSERRAASADARPDFGVGVFVCSKPMQVVVAAAIVRQYAVQSPTVVVVRRTISDADGFVAFLRKSSYAALFKDIVAVDSHEAAAEAVRALRASRAQTYRTLFLEDDRVSFYHLFAPLKTELLAVYEEGIGTYSDDYRNLMQGLRRVKWQVLAATTGCGLAFGGGRETDAVLVQFPGVYRAYHQRAPRMVLPLAPIVDEMLAGAGDWHEAIARAGCPAAQPSERAAIMLGTWGEANARLLERVVRDHDVVYFKPHPHDAHVPTHDKVVLLPSSWIPAEVYISRIAPTARELTVYHFTSSAAMNCGRRFAGVRFVDLCDDDKLAHARAVLRDVASHALPEAR